MKASFIKAFNKCFYKPCGLKNFKKSPKKWGGVIIMQNLTKQFNKILENTGLKFKTVATMLKKDEALKLFKNLKTEQKKLAIARLTVFKPDFNLIFKVLNFAQTVKGKQAHLEIEGGLQFLNKTDTYRKHVDTYKVNKKDVHCVVTSGWEKNYWGTTVRVWHYYFYFKEDKSFDWVGTQSDDQYVWASYKNFDFDDTAEYYLNKNRIA